MQYQKTVRLAVSALLLWPLFALCVPASHAEETAASRTIFDTTPPDTGEITAPAVLQSGPIPVSYSGATDDGSGLERVTLWVRHGEGQPWQETSHSATTAEGSFEFNDTPGEGLYEFALVAEDKAGNVSPLPEGPGAASTMLDSTPPVITLNPSGSSINMVLDVNAPFIDPGATAQDNHDGDISAQIVTGGTVDTSSPGTYFVTYDVSDSAGNAAEQKQRRVEVREPVSYLLTILSPSTGSIQAIPAPGANGAYAMGTLVTLQYHAPTGSAMAVQSWQGAQVNPENNTQATVEMTQNRTVGVTLSQPVGTVQVTVTPQTASWVVTDSTNTTHTGTGIGQLPDLPAGTVSVSFNDLEGYTTPASQSSTLEPGGTVTFTAEYEAMPTVVASVPSGLRGRGRPQRKDDELQEEEKAASEGMVQVPVNLSRGAGIQSYSLTLSFNGDSLAFEDLAAGGLVAAWGAPTVSPSPGAITISGNGPALTSSGGGTLATVTLRVRDNASTGETPLTISSASLNQGGIPVQMANGSVIIEADGWLWGDVDLNGRADNVDANLILRHVIGWRTVLPFREEAGDPNFVGPANVKGAEPPTITIMDAHLISQYARGRISTFPADLNGDGYGPDTADGAKSADLLPEIAATKDTERTLRTLRTVVVEPGVDTRVPISIDSASGVFGYLLEMQFDPAIVEFRNVSKGPLAEEWIEPVHLSEDGVLRWAATGADRLAGTGQLCVVTFRGRPGIAPSTRATLTLSRVELNDKLINASVEADAGTPILETATPARGAVDGYGAIILRGTNLANVDTVLIGGTPAPHAVYDHRTASLRVITPPRGAAGMVDITVGALGEESTLANAFEYYQPELHISLEPESSVFVGEYFEVPIVVNSRAQGVNSLTFVLNFESDVFARSTVDAVVLGGDGSGVQVGEVRSIGAGRLSITLEGAIRSGHLATVNLVVMSPSVNPDTIVYVSDGQAQAGGDAKTVSGGSALPARGRW